MPRRGCIPRQGALRHTPIAGVILTNGEVDAVAGLLSMREGSPFTIYAHEKVLAILQANSIFNVLNEKNWCGGSRSAIARAVRAAVCPTARASGVEVLAVRRAGQDRRGISMARRIRAARTGDGDTLGLKVGNKATGKYFYFSSPPAPG